jgi:hypothetical protein
MHARRWFLLVVASLLVAQSLFAQGKLVVPEGTGIGTIRTGDEEPAIDLKPAEQVAFLFAYGIWGLQGRCLEKDTGLGRLCTLRELIQGVKMPGGEVLGLSVNPVKDTLYNYDILIIGEDCLIRALPRSKGLCGFAVLGSPRRIVGSFYYSPEGSDLTHAVKLTAMGYGGNGFVR